MKGALFLDRDGTIIVDGHYIGDPAAVVLIDGAADAIRTANARAIPVVVVTNQSGIGRGLISMEQYHAVHVRMTALLAEQKATVDASYHCPHWPERDGACDCRKPGLGMHRQAATELGLDLAHSAYIGDRWRDIEGGVKLGGLGIMVPSENTPTEEMELAEQEAHVRATLSMAVDASIAFIDAHVASVEPRDASNRARDAAAHERGAAT